MSTINKNQGSIKLSEVSVDSAISMLATAEREDALTVKQKLDTLLSDASKRHYVLASSDGAITWDQPNLIVPAGVKITFKIEINDVNATSRFVDCEYVSGSLTTFPLTNQITYLELSRANIASGSTITITDGINAAGTSGRRIRNAATLPQVQDGASPESTVVLPILIRMNTNNLYWVFSGQFWQSGVSSEIGINTKIVNVPIGTIVGLDVRDVTDTGTINQAYVTANYPGWWLCDGSVINEPSAPFHNGTTSPQLNNPVAIAPRNYGRFIRGGLTSGQFSGADQVTLSLQEMPEHYHTLNTAALQNHTHNMVNSAGSNIGGDSGGGSSSTVCDMDAPSTPTLPHVRSQNKTHRHSLQSTPSAIAHENNPAWKTLVYIIKIL